MVLTSPDVNELPRREKFMLTSERVLKKLTMQVGYTASYITPRDTLKMLESF